MHNVVNVVFAGLGGQGVLKASDILAELVFEARLDVKKSEVHGMSQRGGSVSSDVRYGSKVASPMVPEGEADFLVVLDETQVSVNEMRLKKNGCLISPSMIATDKLENPKTVNVALLGALGTKLEFSEEAWLEVIRKILPEKIHAVNEHAFKLGKETLK